MTKENKRSIFRKEALEKASSLEDLDKLFFIVKSKDWIALFIGILIIVSILLWSFFGKVTTITGGNGIFMDFSKITTIVSPTIGEIVEIKEHVGTKVNKEKTIAVIRDFKTNEKIEIKPPEEGVITNIYLEVGKKIQKNQKFLEFQKTNFEKSSQERIFCFIPIREGDKIKEGMKVKILPWALDGQKKHIIGKVEKLSYLPADKTYFNRIFLDDNYYNYLTRKSPVIPVIVKPLYYESNIEEPLADDIPIGSFVTVEVILKEVKPITYLLPFWFSKENKL